MGAFLSSLFRLLPRRIQAESPEFTNTIIQSAPFAEPSPVQLVKEQTQPAGHVETNEPLFETVPQNQIEPNAPNAPISHQAPLYKRKSKPELRVHTPQAASGNNILVHEFIWKYGGKQVFLAGSFNDWKADIEMIPMASASDYLHAMVALDPTVAWQFKFVVDGVWRCSLELPTVVDSHGNTNNVIIPESKTN